MRSRPSLKQRLVGAARHRRFQPFWQRLHDLSLIGMNFWSSDLHKTGESDALQYVAAKLRPVERPVIFDVGANFGEFTRMCLDAVGARCIVHAFEPSRTTFEGLSRAFAGNKRVRCHNLALSSSAGEASLYSSEPGSTIASLHQLERPIRAFHDELTEQVRLGTIDQFCASQGIERLDFLKLDIEGHEFEALKGAARMIDEGRIGFIQFEFSDHHVSTRHYLNDFHRLLAEQFDFFRIVPGGPVPWVYEGGRSEIFATMNYLCESKRRKAQESTFVGADSS